MKTGISYTLILILTILSFSSVTRGFRAITSTGVRYIDLKENPRLLTHTSLIDSSGNKFELPASKANAPITLVTFMYTNCKSICRVGSSGFRYIQDQILANRTTRNIKLLSISFDPIRDTPDALRNYARLMHADPNVWKVATVSNPVDLKRLLNEFGIVVLNDGLGGYSHNSAIFIINRYGRLAGAFDINKASIALSKAI